MPQNLPTLLYTAAELRSGGASWDAVARTVHRAPRTCQQWPRRYPHDWNTLYREAEQRRYNEAGDEALAILRLLLREGNDKTKMHSAEVLLRVRNLHVTKTGPEAPALTAKETEVLNYHKAVQDEEVRIHARLDAEHLAQGLPPATAQEINDALLKRFQCLFRVLPSAETTDDVDPPTPAEGSTSRNNGSLPVLGLILFITSLLGTALLQQKSHISSAPQVGTVWVSQGARVRDPALGNITPLEYEDKIRERGAFSSLPQRGCMPQRRVAYPRTLGYGLSQGGAALTLGCGIPPRWGKDLHLPCFTWKDRGFYPGRVVLHSPGSRTRAPWVYPRTQGYRLSQGGAALTLGCGIPPRWGKNLQLPTFDWEKLAFYPERVVFHSPGSRTRAPWGHQCTQGLSAHPGLRSGTPLGYEDKIRERGAFSSLPQRGCMPQRRVAHAHTLGLQTRPGTFFLNLTYVGCVSAPSDLLTSNNAQSGARLEIALVLPPTNVILPRGNGLTHGRGSIMRARWQPSVFSAMVLSMVTVLPVFGKPPELPGEPPVEFKVLSLYIQDFQQDESAPSVPAVAQAQPPVAPVSVLWVVQTLSSAISSMRMVVDTLEKTWWTEQLFEMAEIHFKAEDYAEASRWYQATLLWSPSSRYATMSTKRLEEITTRTY